jgi:hypothetical protein
MIFAMIMLGLLVFGSYANGKKDAYEEMERELFYHEISEMEKLRKTLSEQNKINEQVRRLTGITK